MKGDSGMGSEEKNLRESLKCLRDCIMCHDQNVGRRVDSKSHSDEVSDGKAKEVLEISVMAILSIMLQITWLNLSLAKGFIEGRI